MLDLLTRAIPSRHTTSPPTADNIARDRSRTPLLSIRDLKVQFGTARALRGVDMDIAAGEAVGVIGESGCGKSVTWLASLGLLSATAKVSGSVTLAGEQLLGMRPKQLDTVRGGRIALIFQDPGSALNPVQRIGTQITEVLNLHGQPGRQAARVQARRLLDQVGIPDAQRKLDAYPFELSGGQAQRVMIAMAIAGNPDLLVADEPTTALDVTIQAQILRLLKEIQRETGMALVFVSHDLGVIADICQRAYVMYAGKVVEEAPVADLFSQPRHPYSQALVTSFPTMDGVRRNSSHAIGSAPRGSTEPSGCAFAPRCDTSLHVCTSHEPAMCAASNASHWRVACHRQALLSKQVEDAA
ncbi:peptide/nickel transport system ATP-binding protein [Rhizobium sp. ERR 1071]|nr:peptide/nickel transport system ATP-binding protein [Rhizobium sp. ERR1071]